MFQLISSRHPLTQAPSAEALADCEGKTVTAQRAISEARKAILESLGRAKGFAESVSASCSKARWIQRSKCLEIHWKSIKNPLKEGGKASKSLKKLSFFADLSGDSGAPTATGSASWPDREAMSGEDGGTAQRVEEGELNSQQPS